MGNRCQPSQTGSRNPPGLRATAPSWAAALLLSQTTTTKDSSPSSICPGFNSLLAHLSWAIKHARDEPRERARRCSLFCGAGRGEKLLHLPGRLRSMGKEMSPVEGCAPACRRVRQPRRSRCGFILPMRRNKLLGEAGGKEEQALGELRRPGGGWQHCTGCSPRRGGGRPSTRKSSSLSTTLLTSDTSLGIYENLST